MWWLICIALFTAPVDNDTVIHEYIKTNILATNLTVTKIEKPLKAISIATKKEGDLYKINVRYVNANKTTFYSIYIFIVDGVIGEIQHTDIGPKSLTICDLPTTKGRGLLGSTTKLMITETNFNNHRGSISPSVTFLQSIGSSCIKQKYHKFLFFRFT